MPLVVNELTKPPMPEMGDADASPDSAALETDESGRETEAGERREAVAT